MTILSLKTHKRLGRISAAACIAVLAWIFQVVVLSNFLFQGTMCNLPLTLTILWGLVYGPELSSITPDELRTKGTWTIFIHQAASGSFTGLIFGAFVGALYSSVLPIYPICYPILGFVSGYFCLRNFNPEVLLCIPVVLLLTVAGELVMALQLTYAGHSDVFMHLSQIALPEALLNAIIAPFVYFPMRHWHDYYSYAEPLS